MKKILLPAMLLIFACGIKAQKQIINDPNAVQRQIDPFSAIKVSDAIDLYLSQADQEAAAVSAGDPRNVEHIKTVVENGTLRIYYDGAAWKLKGANKKMKAYIAFRDLQSIEAAGASDVYVNGVIKGESLFLNLSGASDFKGAVNLNQLKVHQSGASDITISGEVKDMEVEASGASNLKGYNLATQSCSAKASGASDIKITVNKELKASASGASSINYKGSAEAKEVRSNGASNITKRD